MGFPRQECWSEWQFPSPGDLPEPGMEPTSPALADRFFPTEPPGKPVLHVRMQEKKVPVVPFTSRAGCTSLWHPVGCVGSGLQEPCGASLGLGEAVTFPRMPAMRALCSCARPYFSPIKICPPHRLPHPGSRGLAAAHSLVHSFHVCGRAPTTDPKLSRVAGWLPLEGCCDLAGE